MIAAHDMMTRLLVSARLLAPDGSKPARGPAKALAQACKCNNYTDLLTTFTAARRTVAESWKTIFDCDLEIEE